MITDLTGKRFGRLVVLCRVDDYINPNNGRRTVRWLCKCDCGNKTLVQTGNLNSGKAQSCGCLARELSSARGKILKPPPQNLIGKRFGRLTVIKDAGRKEAGGVLWQCKCDCGNEVVVETKYLNQGHVQSCGCLKHDRQIEANTIHGKNHTRLYNVWVGMRQRCTDPKHKSYKNYGGRGISVCKEWDEYLTFEQWALSNGYNSDAKYGDCTLDRIDVNGNYCPENCRWVDTKTQAQNKRNSKKNHNC